MVLKLPLKFSTSDVDLPCVERSTRGLNEEGETKTTRKTSSRQDRDKEQNTANNWDRTRDMTGQDRNAKTTRTGQRTEDGGQDKGQDKTRQDKTKANREMYTKPWYTIMIVQ